MSAAKFARAEKDLKAARPLGAAAKAFYDSAEVYTGQKNIFLTNCDIFTWVC